MSRFPDNLFDVADVLGVELEAGEYRLKLGRAVDGLGIASAVPSWGQTGLVCIPDPPTSGDACMSFFVRDGDQLVSLATRDNRYADKIGSLTAGTRGFVTRSAVRMLLNPEHDSWTAYTEDPDGNANMIDLRGEDGTMTFLGRGWTITGGDHEIVMAIDGGATLTLNQQGIFVTGSHCSLACPTGNLGSLGPGVPNVVGVNSIVYGPTGMAGVGSTSWTVSPTPA